MTSSSTTIVFFDVPNKVVVAHSGEEALARATARPPHLVLLDFDMPGMNGVETLSRIRALPGGGEARVVVISGAAGAEQRSRFGALGVREFLDKPVQFPGLLKMLESVAQRSGFRSGAAPPNSRR